MPEGDPAPKKEKPGKGGMDSGLTGKEFCELIDLGYRTFSIRKKG